MLLATLPSSVKVFATLGNHESFPVNQYGGPALDSWLYNGIADAWGPWLDADADAELRYGGYYSVLAGPGLRVVSMNLECGGSDDNFWLLELDTNNLAVIDRCGQLAWLESVLSYALENHENIYLMAHRPADALYDSYSIALHRLIDKYKSVVRGVFVGHTHSDSFTVIRDFNTSTIPITMQFIAPSVTTYTDVNPTYRVYTYDRTDGTVIDYDMFTADIPKANKNNKILWEHTYSFLEAYGLETLTPDSAQHLVSRFSQNNTLLNVWYHHYHTGVVGGSCTSPGCVNYNLCMVASFTQYLADQCHTGVPVDIVPNTKC